MPKFIVSDRIACWVTYTYEIEAEDDTDAYNRYLDGDHGLPLGHEVGTGVDRIDNEVEVEEVKP